MFVCFLTRFSWIQESSADCVENVSYGCDAASGTMWTNNGCRGEFICNGVNTSCSVDGVGKHTCPCGAAGPVTCKGNITDLQKEILFNDDIIAGRTDVIKSSCFWILV